MDMYRPLGGIMKRLLFVLIFLLISSVTEARMACGTYGGKTATATCADSSCSGFDVCQNFEGAGYDNSESWTETCGTGATCDEDYTTSPLRGSQSYYYNAGTGASTLYKTITTRSEYYGFIKVNKISDITTNILVALGANAVNKFYIGYTTTNDKISLTYDSATVCGGTDSFDTGTTYYLWFYYKSASASPGSDGVYRIWLSTTPTKPASPLCESTTQTTVTTTINRLYLNAAANTGETKFDQVLLSPTEIGDVCE
jgi:hypothetical protein